MGFRTVCLAVVIATFVGTAVTSHAGNPDKSVVPFITIYKFLPWKKTSKIKFMCFVPKTIEGKQKLLDIEYSHKPVKVVDEGGARYAVFVFTQPRADFDIFIKGHIELYRDDLTRRKQLGANHSQVLPSHLKQKYLRNENKLEVFHPLIRDIAGTIESRGSRAESLIQTVKGIFDYVTENMVYHDDERCAGALEGAKSGTGQCCEYADLFVALCRAKGIPARCVIGMAIGEFARTPFHSWAEVFIDGLGWVPFDPTWGDSGGFFDRLEPSYIYLSDGGSRVLPRHQHYSSWWWPGDQPVKVIGYFQVIPFPGEARPPFVR